MQEFYITQVSREIEGRVTTKLSLDFSRTENGILGSLPKLGDFPLNLQAPVHCGSVPETSRNSNRENQGMNEYRSKNDPHSEARVSLSQSPQDCCPDDPYDSYD